MKIQTGKIDVLGREIEVQKLQIYADTSKDGSIFYKIEAETQGGKAMVKICYSLDGVLKAFADIATTVLTQQTIKLSEERHDN